MESRFTKSYEELNLDDNEGAKIALNISLSAPRLYELMHDEDDVIQETNNKPAAAAATGGYEAIDGPAGGYEQVTDDDGPGKGSSNLYEEMPSADTKFSIKSAGKNLYSYVETEEDASECMSRADEITEESSEKKKEESSTTPAVTLDPVMEARDWTKEWLAILEEPSSTPLQRLSKLLRLQSLQDDFQRAARETVKIIVEERNNYVKRIPSIKAGGVAGGVKFLWNNIFYKFTLDQEGLYSGDEFSSKAAGRELQGLQSYLRFIVEAGEGENNVDNNNNNVVVKPRLCTSLMCLVDYAGYRVIAASLLPIGSDTLVYGSCDAGRTVECYPSVAGLMEKAGQFLNLKGHITGGKTLFAPTDIEVHRDRNVNQRFFILDTARVFCPEIPPRFFQALIIGCDEEVSAIDLPAQGFEQSVQSLVPEPHIKVPFLLGVVYTSKEATDLNVKVSMLVGVEVYGDALIIPMGHKGKFLYNLLRSEFLSSWKIPLSSDAFSGFGMHALKEHNAEVGEASLHLKSVVLPRVVDLLESGKVGPLTGASLTDMLHRRGINMRLLGLIWSRTHDPAVKLIVMSEMTTRAAKQLLRGAMRTAQTSEQLRVVIVNTFNLLLGKSVASDLFWQTVMQLQLRSKYGSYGEVFEPSAGSYRDKTDLVVLYKRLTTVLGLRFPDVDLNRLDELFQQPNPFSLHWKLEVSERVKPLINESLIFHLMKNADIRTVTVDDLKMFRATEAVRTNPFMSKSASVQLARVLVERGSREDRELAKQLLLEVMSSGETETHIVVSACLIMSEACFDLAEKVAPLQWLVDKSISHSITCVALERMCRVYHAFNQYDLASSTAYLYQLHVLNVPFRLTEQQWIRLFGESRSLCMTYVRETQEFLQTAKEPYLCQNLLPFEYEVIPAPRSVTTVATSPVVREIFPPIKNIPERAPIGSVHTVEVGRSYPMINVEFSATLLPLNAPVVGAENPTDDGSTQVEVVADGPNRYTFTCKGNFELPPGPHMLTLTLSLESQEDPDAREDDDDDKPLPVVEDQCTFKARDTYELQKWRRCLTCWPNSSSSGMCLSCAETCHKGHELGEIEESKVYCDCGAGDAPIKCKLIKDPDEVVQKKRRPRFRERITFQIPAWEGELNVPGGLSDITLINVNSVIPTTVPCGVLMHKRFAPALSNKVVAIDNRSLLVDVVSKGGQVSVKPIRTAGGTFTEVVWGREKSYSETAYFVAINSAGQPFSWGAGEIGQLGHGDKASYELPKVIQALTSSGGIAQVACGAGFCMALSKTNTLFIWGQYEETIYAFPVKITVPDKCEVLKISCCPYGSASEIMVVMKDGTVWHGRPNEGADEPGSPPKLVLCEELSSVQIIDVAAGDRFALYLSKDGHVYVSGRLDVDRRTLSCHSASHIACVTSPRELLLDVLSRISRIYASDSYGIALDQDGTIFYFDCYCLAVKKVTSIRVSHIIPSADSSYVMAYVKRDNAPVKPEYDVPAVPMAGGMYDLRRINHPIDEGCINRDLSIFSDEENMNYRWRVPESPVHRPMEICGVALGSLDRSDLDNAAGVREGTYDYFSVYRRDFGKPPSGRGALNTASKMAPIFKLCSQYDVCTATCTGFQPVSQYMFNCFTCKQACCCVCVKSCHANHDVSLIGTLTNAYCSCGLKTPEGCASRKVIVYMAPTDRQEVLSVTLLREVPFSAVSPDEMAVFPFRRKWYFKLDKWFTACARVRQYDTQFKLKLLEENSTDKPLRSFVSDKPFVRINIESLRVGKYRMVLTRKKKIEKDLGFMEVITSEESMGDEYFGLIPEAQRLFDHSTQQFVDKVGSRRASLTLESISEMDEKENVTVKMRLDLSSVTKKMAESVHQARMLVSRTMLPYCRTKDEFLLGQVALGKAQWVQPVVITLVVSLSSLSLDHLLASLGAPANPAPVHPIIVHCTGSLIKNDWTYLSFLKCDITEAVMGAFNRSLNKPAAPVAPAPVAPVAVKKPAKKFGTITAPPPPRPPSPPVVAAAIADDAGGPPPPPPPPPPAPPGGEGAAAAGGGGILHCESRDLILISKDSWTEICKVNVTRGTFVASFSAQWNADNAPQGAVFSYAICFGPNVVPLSMRLVGPGFAALHSQCVIFSANGMSSVSVVCKRCSDIEAKGVVSNYSLVVTKH